MLELSKQVDPHFLAKVTSHGAADDRFVGNIIPRLNTTLTKKTKNTIKFKECFEAGMLICFRDVIPFSIHV
jgi:hypothetical protein